MEYPIAIATVIIGTTIDYGKPMDLNDSIRGNWLTCELNAIAKLAPTLFPDTLVDFDIRLYRDTSPLLAACKVIALTPETVAYLEVNDPQALKQLRAAITEAGGSNPEQQVNDAIKSRRNR